jgi:hypothetical protein
LKLISTALRAPVQPFVVHHPAVLALGHCYLHYRINAVDYGRWNFILRRSRTLLVLANYYCPSENPEKDYNGNDENDTAAA